jgi:RNA polymerase sigma factor (sigma-70 family)
VSIPSTHLSLLQALGEEGRREDAWVVFQAAYRDVIIGWGRRYGLDLHAAEDLTQEILLKLLEALPRHEHKPDRGRFRSWLKTVVRHVLADRQRRQRRRPEPGGVGGSTALERLGDLPGPEAVEKLSVAVEHRTAAWEAEVLDRVRARVGPASWAAFCQRMIERRPAAEIAAELGLTVGAVYKAADRIKHMVIQECRDDTSPSLPG